MACRVTITGTLVRMTVQESPNRREAILRIAADTGGVRKRQRFIRNADGNGNGRNMVDVEELTDFPTVRVRNIDMLESRDNSRSRIKVRDHIAVTAHITTRYETELGRMITYIDAEKVEKTPSMTRKYFKGVETDRLDEDRAHPDDQNLVLISGRLHSIYIPERGGVPRPNVTRATITVRNEDGSESRPTVTCLGPQSDKVRNAKAGDMVLIVAYVQTRRGATPRERVAPWYETQDIVCRSFAVYKDKEDQPSQEEQAPQQEQPVREEEADQALQDASEGPDDQVS